MTARAVVTRPGDPVVRMQGITKSFGPVRANRNASLEVRAGEIHALVGENGAGKSTLMKILGGLVTPDAGTLAVDGRDVTGWDTPAAITAGVGVVHQHFMLVPTLTVAENLVLGMEPHRGLALNRRAAREAVSKLASDTGLYVDGDRLVADLSVGEAQRVEILKTLYRGARILVLDEPTAVLSPPEVRELMDVLRRVRDRGGTVIIITHRLEEVMLISESITVMRAGSTVARLRTSETTPAEIARAMVGRQVRLTSRSDTASARAAGTPALEVESLVVTGARRTRIVDEVTLAVHAGEIVGIAGVEGNGQTELVEAIAGLRQTTSGRVLLNGTDVTRATVSDRHARGLSHIPEDRQRRGLILDFSVADNLVLGLQDRFTRNGTLDSRAIVSNAHEQARTFDIRPPDPAIPVRALSGGNQQKVVVAREMGREFRVLLAAQPTRGVDVGAIEFIHSQLIRAREHGAAILLVSAELNEVLSLSDRIGVMYRGRLVALLPAADASEEVLGEYMIGARTAA